MDVGEMFLNFLLHNNIKAYYVVNLALLKDLKGFDKDIQCRWSRTWMGFKPILYLAVRQLLIAEDQARGDYLDQNNPFYWDEVKLNFPCTTKFNPELP